MHLGIVKANAEPQSSNEKEFKTMCCGIVESGESTRQRAESLRSKTHEDRIACKSFTSMTHSDLVHKFFPMQQAMKIPDGKAAVDKEWKKLETIQAWDLEKTRAKHQVAREMGSPRLASNRRRRTREGSEPACVQAPFFVLGCHTQGGKGELTSCRGTVWSAWCVPPVSRTKGRPGCPQGYVVTTWYGDDNPHLSLPNSQPLSVAVRMCARVTGKTGENGQNSGDGAARSSWTRPSDPGCGDTWASASFGQSASGRKSPMFLFRK